MHYNEGTKIKLFSFYKSDSLIGESERKKAEDRINNFLKEHDGHISGIQLQDNIIMIIYSD